MLPEGGTMELIAPHVPRPLKREFQERYGDGFEWTIVEAEPGRATVRITKREAGASDGQAAAASGGAGDEHDAATCGHHDDHTHDHEDHAHGHDDSTQDHAADGDGATGGTDSADAAASTGQESETTMEVVEEFDVRGRPPAERHEAIYEAYAALDRGEAFVFVNDHDPKPLYHQFEAEAGPEFRWEYRKKSPGEFEVLVGRAEDPATADGTERADGGAEAPF
jgi:uncharacterized protein (DUF2249 family)